MENSIEFNEIFTQRAYYIIDENKQVVKDVILKISYPVEQPNGEWRCNYQINPIKNGVFGVFGVDGIQAFLLTCRLVNSVFFDFNRENTHQIVYDMNACNDFGLTTDSFHFQKS